MQPARPTTSAPGNAAASGRRRLGRTSDQKAPVEAAGRAASVEILRDVVVVGASAGGVGALMSLAEGLPADFDATIFVVLHLPEWGPSRLAGILDRAGPLPARWAVDRRPYERGVLYVAPPDHHLLVMRGRMRLLRGPKVNGHRPAVDVLFHSAARAHGHRVIGVVLTGSRSDGALGLRAIVRRGGATIVQSDPEQRCMPESARAHAHLVLPLREIPARLTMLAGPSEEGVTTDDETLPDTDLEAGFDVSEQREAPGDPTMLRCPECGGAIWEIKDGQEYAYACHVGHTYSEESMLDGQRDAVERAMWSALRMLEERSALLNRLAERMAQGDRERSRRRFEEQARLADEQAATIRRALVEAPALPGEGEEAVG